LQQIIPQLSYIDILRYLGYRNTAIPKALEELIKSCMELTLQTIQPKSIYHRYPISVLSEGIAVSGTNIILKGKSLRNHLLESKEIFLLAGTIGIEMDKLIRTKMVSSPDEGVILDSCATTAIEMLMDQTENSIRDLCSQNEESITWRFSPGYGDLPLDTHINLLGALDTSRKIGLTVSRSLILIPSKSVTAIIGVTKKVIKIPPQDHCDTCSKNSDCVYKKAGFSCSNQSNA